MNPLHVISPNTPGEMYKLLRFSEPAFHTSKYARNKSLMSSGRSAILFHVPSSGWSTGCVCPARSPARGKFSVFTVTPDRRTVVLNGSALFRFSQDPSVLGFLQTCLFFSRLCVCLKAAAGNAQNTSVGERGEG